MTTLPMRPASMRHPPMSNLRLAASMLVDPRAAFADLDRAPRFWFALLAPLLAHVGVFLWYYGVVDYPWLVQEMISGTPQLRDMPAQQQLQAMPSRDVMMWSTMAMLALGVPVLRVLEAAYFSLAGKLVNVQRTFRHWLALTVWSSFPYLLAIPVMAIPLLLQRGGQTSPEGLVLLSLNELLFQVPRASPWHTLLSSLTLLHPWLWWLSVVGVQTWSGRPLRFSALLALLPMLLVYGGWALLNLL